MNWLLFFLLLVLVATTTTLAVPVESSPAVHNEEGSPTVPNNDNVSTNDLPKASWRARFRTCFVCFGRPDTPPTENVLSALPNELFLLIYSKLLEPDQDPPNRAQIRLRATCKKLADFEIEQEFKFLDYVRGLDRDKVDKNMDILFALIFVDKRTGRKLRGPFGPKGYEERLKSARGRGYYAGRKPFEELMEEELMEEELGRKNYEVLKVLRLVRHARQAIKNQSSQLEHPCAQNIQVDDAQMIQRLVPLLKPHGSTKVVIQKTMGRARYANTLKSALKYKLQNVLRRLVASKIYCPVPILQEFVCEVKEGEIFTILRRHPSFKDDVFYTLWQKIERKGSDKPRPLRDLLVKDKFASEKKYDRWSEKQRELAKKDRWYG